MRLFILTIALLPVFFIAHTDQVTACGADTDCTITVGEAERTYRVRMPDNHDGEAKVGAILFMHGYRGSAKGLMGNKAFGKAVADKGLALIGAKSFQDDWVIPNAPNAKAMHREEIELEYFDALLKDVAERFAIAPERIVAAGFSAGGMMTWTLACHRADSFAAFVPMAGTFWAPHPEKCDSPPAHIIHVHGTSDRVVPLAGRAIADTKQGDVLSVLSMYGTYGGYADVNESTAGDLSCKRQANEVGKILELCLHPDGHNFRSRHVLRAWDELVKLGAL